MLIPSDIQSRIIGVATELFEQAERQKFPTVDAVRRAAKVDMNAASVVMREWRRAQTSQVGRVTIQVPDEVNRLYQQAMMTAWEKAQELATENLRAAQARWDAEREELDAMRQEVVDAFDAQATELEQVRADAIRVAQDHECSAKRAIDEVSTIRAELGMVSTRAERAEAKCEEMERRISDLHGELDRVRQDADKAQVALNEVTLVLRAAQDAAVVAEAEKQTERKTAQAEADRLRDDAQQAREEAAQMRGELDTLRTQNAAFLASLRPVDKPVRPMRKKKVIPERRE